MSIAPRRPAWGDLNLAFKAEGVATVEVVTAPGPHRGKVLVELAVRDAREGRLPVLLPLDQVPGLIARLKALEAPVYPPELAEFLDRRWRR